MNREEREWQRQLDQTMNRRPAKFYHVPDGSRLVGSYAEASEICQHTRRMAVYVRPDGKSECRTPTVGGPVGVAFDTSGMGNAEVVAEAMRRTEALSTDLTCTLLEVL